MPTQNATKVLRDIGRKIAEIRAAKGWTQERFAEALGIAVQNVARMEQGRQNLTVRTIVRLARTLGCTPRSLWDPVRVGPSKHRARKAKPVAAPR